MWTVGVMPSVDTSSLLAVAVIALGMAVTPGPNVIYLVSRTVEEGRRSGLIALGGVGLGYLLHLTAAVLGLATLLIAVPALYSGLQIVGAAYLGWLAWRALRTRATSVVPAGRRASGSSSPVRLMLLGTLTNVLNPKAPLMYASLIPQFINLERGHLATQAAVLGGTHIAVSLAAHVGLVCGAGSFAAFMQRRPSWLRAQRYATAAVLGVFAAELAVSAVGLALSSPAAPGLTAAAPPSAGSAASAPGSTASAPPLAGSAASAPGSTASAPPPAGSTASAPPPAGSTASAPSLTAAAPPSPGRTGKAPPAAGPGSGQGKYYVVGPPVDGQREYLYAIAAKTLGDGRRDRELAALNRDRPQPDGRRMTDPLSVEPGWILLLPADADGGDVRIGAPPMPAPGTPAAAGDPRRGRARSPLVRAAALALAVALLVVGVSQLVRGRPAAGTDAGRGDGRRGGTRGPSWKQGRGRRGREQGEPGREQPGTGAGVTGNRGGSMGTGPEARAPGAAETTGAGADVAASTPACPGDGCGQCPECRGANSGDGHIR
jgi:threonine/homoserine/homoserine lactone efflux protein